ncbi:MAG: hypothetical protein J5I59_03240 [Saprospiraceae bacterium]|nr:hypothetical protein [Saprospiraceae bacterium]
MKNIPALLLVALCSFLISACKHDENKLLLAAGQLFCKRQLLIDSSQNLWANVAYHLKINMGPEVDSVTRKRMLTMKNAAMLASLQAYNRLPDSVKSIIQKAGTVDRRLVDEIAEVSFSIDSIEVKKEEFLKKAGMNSSRAKKFLAQYKEYIASPCKFTSTN